MKPALVSQAKASTIVKRLRKNKDDSTNSTPNLDRPQRATNSLSRKLAKKHPEWDYRLWTTENLPNDFVNQNLIDGEKSWNGKSDYIRYELLSRYGGVYVDADSFCIKPLDELMTYNSFGAWTFHVGKLIATGVIGFPKSSETMTSLIDHASPATDFWHISGRR